MKLVETACTYDCPDACALLAGASGSDIELRGHPDHPITRGFICGRLRRHPRRLRSSRRLTSPLLRQGTSLVECSWDRALDFMARRLAPLLEKHPQQIAVVPGGGSLGLRKLLVSHFFNSLGPVTNLGGGVCDETGAAAQRLDFGDCCGHDYLDLENSRALVLWGKNPAVGAPHLVPFLRELRARKLPVVVIDLWPGASCAHASRFIPVRPGADAWLAMAVLKLLLRDGHIDAAAGARCQGFDQLQALCGQRGLAELVNACGASLADVEYLAGLYAGGPVATHIGWGLQRRRRGGLAVRWIDALCVLSGQVGRAGGGASYNPGRKRGLDTGFLAPARGATLAAPLFAEQLAASRPPVSFAYLYGVNLVDQFADSQSLACVLRQTETVVVADAFLTDTARAADLVLPVTLMLEDEYDLVGSYGHHWVARAQRVVAPPAGVKEDVEIVHLLARRLDLPADPWLAEPRAALERMSRPWFSGDEPFARNPCQPEIPFAAGFATPSGRAQLVDEPPEQPPRPDPAYPLLLLSPKRREFEHSQQPLEQQLEPAVCLLNPQAPGLDGIVPEGRVRLVSRLGAMEVRLVLRPELPRDLCVVAEGGWLSHDTAVNKLVEARATDVGDGTAFYDQQVRLEPIDDQGR